MLPSESITIRICTGWRLLVGWAETPGKPYVWPALVVITIPRASDSVTLVAPARPYQLESTYG